ncbi:MAG: hypothetical protein KGL39_05305 [Patescibacteria group bacterium]|nr:hypothetical protein [Patescibacteria group bacterium]
MTRLVAAAWLTLAGAAFAQQPGTLSSMPFASTPYNGSEQIYLVQNGLSSKATIASLAVPGAVLAPGVQAALGIPVNTVGGITTYTLGLAGSQQIYYPSCATSANGVSDNTTCIQSSVNQACSASGGVSPYRSAGLVLVPQGVYVISGQIGIPCNGLSIRGTGNGNTASGNLDYRNTVFKIASGFVGHALFAYTSTTSDYGSGLEIGDFSIDATNEPSNSWLFDISWLQHARIHDISILSPTNVLTEIGGAINLMENVSTLNQTGTGVDFSGDSSGCSAVFVGGVSSGVMTVSSMVSGTINSDNGNPAKYVFLPNTPASYTTVQSQTSGTPGGVGVYQIFFNGSLASSLNVTGGTTMYASDINGCNKRADLLRLRNDSFNVSGATGSGGGICINYHNFAQTLAIDHVVCESPYVGMNIFCDASQGNFGETCPAFGRFSDLEMEGCAYRCINSSDAQDMEYSDTYALGLGSGSGDIVASFVNTNFQQCPTNSLAGVFTQGLRFHGGRVGNSAKQNMFVAVCEFDIHDVNFFLPNLANGGYPSIEFSPNGGFVTYSGLFHHNILCEVSGQQPPGLTMFGVTLDAGANNITVDHNIGRFCGGAAHLVTDNSATLTNIVDRNSP